MDITTSLATARLLGQQRMMEVTANNIANANTPGYRTTRVQFSDWIDPGLGVDGPQGSKPTIYPQDRATWRETQPGTVTHTGNPYDLAITGDGYFSISTPNGVRLTRDGRFGLMPDGTIADSAGNALLGTDGRPIQLSPSDTQVHIAGDGTISTENGQVGKVGVVVPKVPAKMQAEGSANFRVDDGTTPVTTPSIVQGAMEDSNVQPVLELTRMMDNERQFQMLTQLVQAEGDRQQNAIEKLLPQNGS
ncbi:MAG TPA: flagellar hook-basal body complex protein [Rhodopila sp.]|uniref:flagellar hook-basal body complex protein n=1 Tax=Rhodopila sp. TaxID=2480087 RepID=UPI002BCA6010|nr:flagellar hook-basal body complex protein [Rhodopila sp.]HVY17756.1 flagellar hook-basal body complex protein [Rhodopila sp.]